MGPLYGPIIIFDGEMKEGEMERIFRTHWCYEKEIQNFSRKT
jgi:hypothetical protein